MKSIKISIVALSLGLFIASCNNSTECKTSASDTTVTTVTSGVPTPTDTAATANTTASATAGADTSAMANASSGAVHKHTGSGKNSEIMYNQATNGSATTIRSGSMRMKYHSKRSDNDTFVDHRPKQNGDGFTNGLGSNPQ